VPSGIGGSVGEVYIFAPTNANTPSACGVAVADRTRAIASTEINDKTPTTIADIRRCIMERCYAWAEADSTPDNRAHVPEPSGQVPLG